jgi:hypothetical protein
MKPLWLAPPDLVVSSLGACAGDVAIDRDPVVPLDGMVR